MADPKRAELLRDTERFGRERDGTTAQHQGHRSGNIRFYSAAYMPSLGDCNVFSRVFYCLEGSHVTMTHLMITRVFHLEPYSVRSGNIV